MQKGFKAGVARIYLIKIGVHKKWQLKNLDFLKPGFVS